MASGERAALLGGAGAGDPGVSRRGSAVNRYASLVAVTASISGFCFGYEIGIIASVLEMDSFRLWSGTGVIGGDGAVTPTASDGAVQGTIVSLFLVGAVLGSLLVYFLADAVGRRGSILVGAALFVAGGVLQAAAPALPALLAGRVLSGVGVGLLSMAAPLYLSETAATAARGRLIATQQLLIVIGVLAASCVNTALYTLGGALGDAQWRLALAAQVAPGAALALVMLPLPRSPRWLVSVDRSGEARAVLARLRGLPPADAAVEAELREIVDEVLAEFGGGGDKLGGGEEGRAAALAAAAAAAAAARWSPAAQWRRLRELAAPDCAPQLLVVVALQFFQQATGINVVLYYAADLFSRAGVPDDAAATWFVMGNAALLVAGVIPGMLLVDSPRVGRRALLLAGAAAMMLCLAASTALISASERGGGAAASAGAVAALWSFTVCFSATWGPVVWVVQSEVLPLRNRAQGGAVGTLVNWVTNAIIAKAVPLLIDAAGAYTYLLFAGCCAAAFVYVALAVPETAGVSLEGMGALFRAHRRSKAAAAAEADAAEAAAAECHFKQSA